MIEQDKKIRKGLPPRRDAACIRVLQDITIPADTILRDAGNNKFTAQVGVGGEFAVVAEFTMTVKPGMALPGKFKRVVA